MPQKIAKKLTHWRNLVATFGETLSFADILLPAAFRVDWTNLSVILAKFLVVRHG